MKIHSITYKDGNAYFLNRKYSLHKNGRWMRMTKTHIPLSWDIWNYYNPDNGIESKSKFVIHHINGKYDNGEISNIEKITRGVMNMKHKHKWTEEEKRIKSENMKGKRNSPDTEFKKENKPWNYGKKMSMECREKMSKAKKGKPTGRSPAIKGKHHTEETKRKMRESHKGKKYKKHTTDAWNKGLKWNEEIKAKIRKSRMWKCVGVDNPNWKGGISIVPYFGLSKYQYEKLTKNIRTHDNYICQYCGKSPAYDVHHIFPQRIKIDNHPDNLITLCKSCHPKIEILTRTYTAQNKNPIEIFYEKWSE